jgi:hypothetical protein
LLRYPAAARLLKPATFLKQKPGPPGSIQSSSTSSSLAKTTLKKSAAVLLDCFSWYMFLSGLILLWLGKLQLLPVCSLMVGDLVRVLRIAVCFGVAYVASVPIRFAFPLF